MVIAFCSTSANETAMKLRDEKAHSKATVEKKPSINQVVSNFCSYTTAHGLGRLAESRSVFRRVVWSLFCLGALTMFVIQMYNLFVIYLSRPVSTVVNVHHESVSNRVLRVTFGVGTSNQEQCDNLLYIVGLISDFKRVHWNLCILLAEFTVKHSQLQRLINILSYVV